MGRVKSVFIGLLPMVMLGQLGLAVARMVRDGPGAMWLAVAAQAAIVAGFFAVLMAVRRWARVSGAMVWLTVAVGALGAATVVTGLDDVSGDGVLAAGSGGVTFVLWLAYVFWYSRLDREESGLLRVGQKLPAFDLREVDGTVVSSASFEGRSTLLMFYRGNWCPLCMAQIKEIAAGYRELADRGVEVVLVSPQSESHTESLAARFDAPFRFLVDRDLAAAKGLKIAAPGGTPMGMQLFGYEWDTVLPTVVITDADGTILFADQTDNYRHRPEPETFLRVLDAAE
ncbi:MAG: AhpC/TSA family protein [Deltaproteobacteria bacterium]|nr:AhpC/TSA family protein [Deltaproteobacteria bacterium]